jgi:MFS family permease
MRDEERQPIQSPVPEVAGPTVTAPTAGRMRIGVLRPLALPDFRLLWTGFFVSLLGDGIYFVAIAWEVYRLSNSPTALSVVAVAWSLPMVAFVLLGGVVTDRFDRRLVMIAADIVRGLAIGGMGILSATGAIRIWHLVVLAAVYGIGQAFFNPAFGAIVPELVPDDLLVEANSLNASARPLAERLMGPAIGGVIVALVGASTAFLVDATTFAVSAVAVAFIRTRPVSRPTEKISTVADIKEGFAFVRSQTWLWATLVAASFTLLFVMGPFQVLVPFVVKNELGGGAHDLGLVFAAGGVGSILAGITMGQIGLPRHHVLFMYAAWAFGVSLMWPYAIMNAPWQAMVTEFVAWASFAAGMVVWNTLMQRLVPRHLLGRVTSLDWLISTGLMPLSFAATGPVSEAIGLDATFIASGFLGAIATFGVIFVRGVREPETLVR